MKTFILVAFAVLLCGVIAASWYITLNGKNPATADDWKNFATIAGVGAAAVAGLISTWVSFRNLDAQARTSRDLEQVKQVLAHSIPAYGVLFAAASKYYRCLAPLETGQLDRGIVEGAEEGMKQAEGDTLFVSDDFLSHWQGFWTHARYLKEMAHADATTDEDRKKLWAAKCKALAWDLKSMRNVAQGLVRSGTLAVR